MQRKHVAQQRKLREVLGSEHYEPHRRHLTEWELAKKSNERMAL